MKLLPRTIRANGIDIEYDIADYTLPWLEQEPETILLHHGFCRNMDFWRQWVPDLSRNYRVLRFNSRGCGATTEPEPGARYDALVLMEDAIALLDALEIPKVHWIGEYSGGVFGLLAAIHHPDRLNTLTIINSPFKLNSSTAQAYSAGQGSHVEAITRLGSAGYSRSTIELRLDLSRASDAVREWVIAEMGKVAPHVAIGHIQLTLDANLLKDAASIRIPVLNLVGEHSPMAQAEQLNAVRASMLDAQVVVFEGYGHAINLLAAERCLAEVNRFLCEHSAR